MRMHTFNPAGKGVQTATGRLYNRRVVLSLIALNPGISAVNLARQANLAPQTVGSLVSELQQAGLVEEGEPMRGKRGQPARPLRTLANGSYAIGVEVGPAHVIAVLVNLAGETVDRYRRNHGGINQEGAAVELRSIVDLFVARTRETAPSKVCGIGLVVSEAITDDVDPLRLAADVKAATNYRTEVISDGGAACWAAYRQSPRPRPLNFASIHLDWSVTGGLVLGGNLYEGESSSKVADYGQLSLDGSSTLTSVASVRTLEAALRAEREPLPELGPEFWPWSDLPSSATIQWAKRTAAACARAAVVVLRVTGVRTIALSGNLPQAALLRIADEVQSTIRSLTDDRDITIFAGTFGSASPALGAAYLILFRAFFSRESRFLAENE